MKKKFLSPFFLGALLSLSTATAQNCPVTNSYTNSNIPSTFTVSDPNGATNGTISLSSTTGVQMTNLNTATEGRVFTTLSSPLSNTSFSAECQTRVTAGNNPITVLMGFTSGNGQPWTVSAQNEILVALTQPGSNAGSAIDVMTSGSFIALYTKLAPNTSASPVGTSIAIPASAIGNFRVRLVRKSATSVTLSAYNATTNALLGERCITINAGIINLNTVQVGSYTGHITTRFISASVNNIRIANNCIENQAPNPTITNSNVCAYQGSPSTATMFAPTGYTNIVYRWYASNSTSSTVLATTPTYANASTTAGTITVYGRYTATNSCGDAVVSNLIPVSLIRLAVPATPTVTVPGTKICQGETVQLTPSVQGGVWSISPTGSTISTTGLFTGINPGLFRTTYVVTGANGCSSAVNTDITVGALPFEILGPDQICINSANTYTVNQQAVGNLYTWRRDGNTVSTLATNGVLTTILNAGNAAANSTITLTAQGDFQCMDGTKKSRVVTKQITYAANPSAVLIKCGDATCNSLTATNAAGLTLRWYHYPNGLQELGSATTITNPKVNTTIYLDVTNTSGCKTTFYWYPYQVTTCNTVYDNNRPLYPNQGFGARMANNSVDNVYNLIVHPNPTSNNITFESDGSEGSASIFNAQGVILETIELNLNQRVYNMQISDYASGVYYLQVYSSDGKVYSTAIVKQ